VVVVSHDEAILETCTHITEVRGSKLHQFTGTYTEFLAMRKLREEQALAAAASANAAINRTEAFMAKWGAKTAFAGAAKSREKSLAKLKENLADEPAAASAFGGGDATKASMRFLPPPPCHREMLKLKDAVVGWNGTPLFAPLQLTIEKGQRILVLGPNGAGKSSMLRCALAGSDPLLSGSRTVGEGVKMAVFAQDLAQELPLEMRALDYVLDKARREDGTITLEQGRKSLGSLGLTGDSAYRVIGQLSGGEKARVALAAFALIPYNLLLLDEPSNHVRSAAPVVAACAYSCLLTPLSLAAAGRGHHRGTGVGVAGLHRLHRCDHTQHPLRKSDAGHPHLAGAGRQCDACAKPWRRRPPPRRQAARGRGGAIEPGGARRQRRQSGDVIHSPQIVGGRRHGGDACAAAGGAVCSCWQSGRPGGGGVEAEEQERAAGRQEAGGGEGGG
jgi:ABC-type molybdenum transport system ATPase subunit/photorepair protein PhrA